MNCNHCGAAVNLKSDACVYCGASYPMSRLKPLGPERSQKFRKRGLYPLLIVIGIVAPLLVYGMFFDSLTENQLIALTPAWFFALVFGLFGYKAEGLLLRVCQGEAEDFRDAYKQWIGGLAKILPVLALAAALLFFPLPLGNRKTPLAAAALGALIWGILLVVFFLGIFPQL